MSQVQLVTFDGIDDYLNRGADLSGNANGKKGIISWHVDLNGGDGALMMIWETRDGGGTGIQITRAASNKFNIAGYNAASSLILNMVTTGTYTASGGRVHILASWDLGATTGHLYIDDVDAKAASPTLTNDTLDYTKTDHAVGARPGGSYYMDADGAELYVNFAEYLDLSITSNRRRFITARGNPAKLGLDGSGPTGTAPIAFFSGPVASWHTNKGSGGGFTENGAISDSGKFGGRDVILGNWRVPV